MLQISNRPILKFSIILNKKFRGSASGQQIHKTISNLIYN